MYSINGMASGDDGSIPDADALETVKRVAEEQYRWQRALSGSLDDPTFRPTVVIATPPAEAQQPDHTGAWMMAGLFLAAAVVLVRCAGG